MPYPSHEESKEDYIKKFMESKEAKRDYPDNKQRIAIAISIWKDRNKNKDK